MFMSNELAKLPENFFDDILPDVEKVIPADTIKGEALARVILTAINRTPDLRACSKGSIISCLFDIASLALMPNTPRQHCWLIPYRIEGVLQATLQLGYLGFCELAYRSNQVKMIQSDVVRDGDEFRYSKGVGDIKRFVEHVKQIGKGRNGREVLGAWASVEMINGGHSIEVADQDDLFKIRAMATKRQESPAWKFHEDQMFRKVVLKRLLKLLQIDNMSIVHKAIDIDNKVSGVLPPINGIDKPAPAEHKLVLTDALPEGATVLEPEPEKPSMPSDTEEHEYTWEAD